MAASIGGRSALQQTDPAALAMSRQVTAEDRAICEAVQRNLATGVYEKGRLSPRHEGGVFAFQSRVRAWLA